MDIAFSGISAIVFVVGAIVGAFSVVAKIIKPLIDWGGYTHGIKKDKVNAMISHYKDTKSKALTKELVYSYAYDKPVSEEEIDFFEEMGNITKNLPVYLRLNWAFKFESYPKLVDRLEGEKLDKEIKASRNFFIFFFLGTVIYFLISVFIYTFRDPSTSYNDLLTSTVFLIAYFILWMFFMYFHSLFLHIRGLVGRIEKHIATRPKPKSEGAEQISTSQANA